MNTVPRYNTAHLFPCSGSTFLVYSSVSSFVSFQNPFNSVYFQADTTNVHRICSYTQSCTNSCITHMTYYSSGNPHSDALRPRWLGNSLLSKNTGKKRGKECRKSSLPSLLSFGLRNTRDPLRSLKKHLELQLHCDVMGAKAHSKAGSPLIIPSNPMNLDSYKFS